MFRLIIITALVSTASSALGQYFQYSQYNYAAQRINPATVASSDYATLGLLYRQQATGGDVDLKSTFSSVAYPLLNPKSGRRWAGLGMTIMDDRANNIFLTQEASISYAMNIFLTRYSTLSLGTKALYQQSRLNLDGLFTGAQFIPDHGFDRFIDNGENIDFLRSSFFTFSTGLYWQQSDRQGNRVSYLGVSLFDFNKPNGSFVGTNADISSTVVAQGGFKIYGNETFSIFPELLFTRSTSNNVINVGAVTSYFLNSGASQSAGRIDLLTKYVPGRSGILGLQWHGENISIGCSRDFPITANNSGNIGAYEVAIELKNLVNHKLKREALARKRHKKKQTSVAQRMPNKNRPAPIKRPGTASVKGDTLLSLTPLQQQHVDMKTTLKQKQDSVLRQAQAGKVSHEPFVIEEVTLHFNFQFNSSNLDEASSHYLDELSNALMDNEHLKITLTGHTDNIGSPKFNERLSLFRANTIKEYLVKKGIDPNRIETAGKGLKEPLNDNSTEEHRAENRRVELMILYNE